MVKAYWKLQATLVFTLLLFFTTYTFVINFTSIQHIIKKELKIKVKFKKLQKN